MAGFWDSFSNGDRFKFVNVGDIIEGEILRLSVTDFGGSGDMAPVLHIKTEQGDKELTASQVALQRRLAEQAPEVGDLIRIRFDGEAESARPGRSPAKLFTVTVKKQGKPAEAPTPPSDEPF